MITDTSIQIHRKILHPSHANHMNDGAIIEAGVGYVNEIAHVTREIQIFGVVKPIIHSCELAIR